MRVNLLSCLAATLLLGLAAGTLPAEDRPVPDDLLKALKDREPGARVKAIMGLSRLGAEAVPHLVGALKDDEAEVSQAAAYGLRLVRATPEALAAALGPFARDPDARVRQGVAGALGRCGKAGVPLLVPSLEDAEAGVRRQAVFSLQDVLKRAPEAAADVLPAVARRLKDNATPVRLMAVQTLPRCGKGAVPALVEALRDEEAPVRAYALDGLLRLKPGPKDVLPAVVERLEKDSAASVRQSALRTLGTLGPDALPHILAALEDKDPTVQNAALKALSQVGPEAGRAVAAVRRLAATALTPAVRTAAVQALAKIGPEGPALFEELLKERDSATRLECLKTLGRAGNATREAVPALIAALGDNDREVRILAAHVLGQIGPGAREAVEALNRAAQDSDKDVKETARKALEKVQGK
jgi:HEAT repeat protein